MRISALCFLMFYLASTSITAQSDLETKFYYWEDVNNQSHYYHSKSTIELKGDSVIIIDYPDDDAGRLNYSSGIFYYNVDSTLIKCVLSRSLSFSLNTLFVIDYRLDCDESLEFSIGTDSPIASKIELKPQYQIKDIDRPKQYVELEYSLQEAPKRLIPSEWYNNFENYDRTKRLQPCQ